MNLEAIPVGTLVPDGFNHVGQVLGERPDKLQSLAFPVGVPSQKKYHPSWNQTHLLRQQERCEGLLHNGVQRGEVEVDYF